MWTHFASTEKALHLVMVALLTTRKCARLRKQTAAIFAKIIRARLLCGTLRCRNDATDQNRGGSNSVRGTELKSEVVHRFPKTNDKTFIQ